MNNIFATAHFRNNRWFAQPRAGRPWAISDDQAEQFDLEEGMEIRISFYAEAEQYCKVEGVTQAA